LSFIINEKTQKSQKTILQKRVKRHPVDMDIQDIPAEDILDIQDTHRTSRTSLLDIQTSRTSWTSRDILDIQLQGRHPKYYSE
jgi:hypothetical protein